MLTIYTHSWSPFTKEFWKWVARKIIGKYSGPDAVRDSLERGLTAHGIRFIINPFFPRRGVTIVLSGVQALHSCILRKRSGKVTKLIAGPNIVSHPNHANKIILSDEIDTILMPSQWTIDFWSSNAPEVAHKISFWPAGVSEHSSSARTGNPIIYNKRPDTTDAQNIANSLQSKGITPTVLTYGAFKQIEYFTLLSEAPYLIYVSEVESQGLALQEAWSRDVPTLVPFSGSFTAPHGSWSDPKINAPLLTDELGGFFQNESELYTLIEKAKIIHPKTYCDTNLSDFASVQKLLPVVYSTS